MAKVAIYLEDYLDGSKLMVQLYDDDGKISKEQRITEEMAEKSQAIKFAAHIIREMDSLGGIKPIKEAPIAN